MHAPPKPCHYAYRALRGVSLAPGVSGPMSGGMAHGVNEEIGVRDCPEFKAEGLPLALGPRRARQRRNRGDIARRFPRPCAMPLHEPEAEEITITIKIAMRMGDKKPGPIARPGLSGLIRQRATLPRHNAEVPSPQRGLTAVFGMGTGMTPSLWPPKRVGPARTAYAIRAGRNHCIENGA